MKNLKLMVKLLGSFIIVALITVAVGIAGWFGIKDLTENIVDIGDVQLPAIYNMVVLEKEIESIRVAQRTLLIPTLSKSDRARETKFIEESRKKYRKAWDNYAALPQTKEEAAIWDKFVPSIKEWAVVNNRFNDQQRRLVENGILNPADLRKLLEGFRGDHYKMMMLVTEAIQFGKTFEGGGDPRKCAFGEWMETVNIDNTEFKELLSKIKEPHAHFHHAVAEIKQLAANGNTSAAWDLYHSQLIPDADTVFTRFQEMRNLAGNAEAIYAQMDELAMVQAREKQKIALGYLNRLIQINEEDVKMAKGIAQETASKASILSASFMAIGALLALILGYVLSKSIITPVMKGVDFAKSLSEGDLTQTMEVHQKDEIGILAEALRNMKDKLTEVVFRCSIRNRKCRCRK